MRIQYAIKIKYALFFSLASLAAHAQQPACEAENFFSKKLDCSTIFRGLKCVELDVSHSLDKEGKEFKYTWNFGDGTIKNGYFTEYCYKQFGTYTISLDLVDPKTNLVIRNELTTTVKLFPAVGYETDTVKQMSLNFRYDPELIPGVDVKKVFWKIEDAFSCGETTFHTFKREGLHILEVGVEGELDGKIFLGCTLMGVYIEQKK